MEIASITVTRRSARGRNQILRLRQQGKVPVVLYGEGGDNLALSVSESELARHLREHHQVFQLLLEDKKQPIFLKDIQYDTLTDRPLHADFLRIDLDKKLEVEVELRYIGHPKGAAQGGILIQDMVGLAVSSLPAAIPEYFEIQVGGLEVGDEVKAGDVPMPTGVTLMEDPDTLLCRCIIDLPEPEPEPEETAEGEAEGEKAEGDEAKADEETPGDS